MCTGNCSQGRACDCCPDVDIDDRRDPLTATERALMAVIGAASAAIAIGLTLALLRVVL